MRVSQIARIPDDEACRWFSRLLAEPTDMSCQDAATLLQTHESVLSEWLIRDYATFRKALLVHHATLAGAAYSMLVRHLKTENAVSFFEKAAAHKDMDVIETLVNARPELRPAAVEAGISLPEPRTRTIA